MGIVFSQRRIVLCFYAIVYKIVPQSLLYNYLLKIAIKNMQYM